MKRRKKEKLGLRLEKFLKSHPPPSIPGPYEIFIEQILRYKLMPFHGRWWNFVNKNSISLVLAPRGHGKSTILTVCFTLYRILDNPNLRVLIASDTAAQAKAFVQEIKRHIESNPRIGKPFGDLRGKPWTNSELCLLNREHCAKESTVTALGVMGPVISKHYDIIILDDVVDEEAAASRLMRQKMLTWYYKELLPTLEPHGELHLLGTRYHHDDLYGRLIDGGVPHLVERAIVEENGIEKALWQEKFSLALLRQKRAQAGPAIFNAQYQNDVTAMKGRVFRPEWIKVRPAPALGRKYQGVDLAIGTGDRHDYFAHVTVAEVGKGAYHVVGVHRGRLSFEDQFQTIKSLFALHDKGGSPVARVGVEANAYQEAMVQKLRAETNLPVAAIKQTRDKLARAMRVQGLFQTGMVSFEPAAESTALLIEELLSFPDADHDDLVDALEMAISVARDTRRYLELPGKDLDVEPRM